MRKYTIRGNEVHVIGELNGLVMGHRIYEQIGNDGEMDEFEGPIEHISDTLFDEPPKQKLSAEIAVLVTRRAALEATVRKLESSVRSLGSEINAAEKAGKARGIKAVENLQAFIDGKITHLVIPEQFAIKTLADALETKYDGQTELRMLSLYGRAKGDLSWRTSEYSDGSGSRHDTIPCLSLDEARATLAAHIDANPAHRYALDAAEHYGLLPLLKPETVKDIKAKAIANAKRDLEYQNVRVVQYSDMVEGQRQGVARIEALVARLEKELSDANN